MHIPFTKLEKYLLSFILLFATCLYLYKLDIIPPGMYIDEAGTGYNAWSIANFGKDEYGKTFPLAMRLFGSYSPPLYVYLSAPIIKTFGLSVFTTRLLSAISGILVVATYYIFLKNLKLTKSKYTPLISTLLLTITPWLVFFSRTGYEQNLALLFFTVSALLTYKSINNPKLIGYTIPFLSLTTYTDYPQRLIAPLLFFYLTFTLNKKILAKHNIRYFLTGVGIAFLIQLPNLYLIFTPSFYTKTEHLFTGATIVQAQKIAHFLPAQLSLLLAFLRELFSKFSTFFSPRSLFFEPDPDIQRSIPQLSVFYNWMLFPYLLGLHSLWKTRSKTQTKLTLALLLITPLPGALTKEPFHIQRTLPLLIPLSLTIAMGIDKLLQNINVKIWLPITLGLFAFSLLLLWRSYFILLPYQRTHIWGNGFKQLAEIIHDNPKKTFLIDQRIPMEPKDVAYIQMGFHLQIPYYELRKTDKPEFLQNYYQDIEFVHPQEFANIRTKPIDWGEVSQDNTILVGDTVSVSPKQIIDHNLQKIFEIKDPDGKPLLIGYEQKK